MSYREKYGGWALVVGGSTTIGEQFCRQLAARGMDIIMVARQRDLLEQLARGIESKHAVQARAVTLDLTAGGSIERLLAETAELEIGFLVVNANLHKINAFDDMDSELKHAMLQMNALNPAMLCHHYGAPMVARGKGAILLVGAASGLMGLENDAIFQGSKSFLQGFAESLWLEYRKHGVRVAVSLVSAIKGSTSYEAKTSARSRTMLRWVGNEMPPETIVAKTLRCFEKKDYPIIIPDHFTAFNRMVFSLSLFTKLFRFRWLNLALSKMTNSFLDGEEVKNPPESSRRLVRKE
jgi:short-subunit dehydrogenase